MRYVLIKRFQPVRCEVEKTNNIKSSQPHLTAGDFGKALQRFDRGKRRYLSVQVCAGR